MTLARIVLAMAAATGLALGAQKVIPGSALRRGPTVGNMLTLACSIPLAFLVVVYTVAAVGGAG